MILFVIGFILGFFVGSYLTVRYFVKRNRLAQKMLEALNKSTKDIAEKITTNNLKFDDMKKVRDKSYMEKQLLIKLKRDADFENINKEAIEKLVETGMNKDDALELIKKNEKK